MSYHINRKESLSSRVKPHWEGDSELYRKGPTKRRPQYTDVTSKLSIAETILPVLGTRETLRLSLQPIGRLALLIRSPWLARCRRFSRFLSGTRAKERLRRLEGTDYTGSGSVSISEQCDSCSS
jgi:hypothetical protein